MNIYKILQSKPHNKHYLKRYIKFIQSCIEYNKNNPSEYTENHHICPKSKDMFPEYKNLNKNLWNKCALTYRQHIIAHLILYKAYNTESQLLAVLFTVGQFHTKNLNLKSINTKTVEKLKITLSEKRKGVFTRGYDLNGVPLVKESTKKLLSKIKTELYKDENNRKKQSEACKGTTGRKSEKYSIAAKNRTAEHINKISKGVKKYYTSLSDLQKKRINSGIYVTPFGNFTCLTNIYRNYCLNNQKIFNIHSTKNNPHVNKSVIGKTPAELGFNFISKNDPTISQYYDGLNQVRQPEPNHPLLLELNDFLLQQKFLP